MHARGPAIERAGFYRDCAAVLAEPGVCVVNLFGRHASYRRNLERIECAFGGRVLELPALRVGNRVVLGFKGPPLAVEWSALEHRARVLRRVLGLPAHEWAQALRARSGAAACVVCPAVRPGCRAARARGC